MKFSQDFIEKVREANNVVDLIGQFTQLKATGGGHMGRCPFPDHNEKTPSFSVSETKQVYHCFGCKKSGNIFTFLRDYQGMDFPQAMEYLAKRAAIIIPQEETKHSPAQSSQKKKRDMGLQVNRLAGSFFMQNLKNSGQRIKDYLKTRGLDEEICETFKLGYASESWEGLAQFLNGKRAPLPLAIELGLIKAKSGQPGQHYDTFRDRLIFPILSPFGDPIGFGGRIIDQGQPKYLNSPENILFQKGKTLYGLHETARYIRPKDAVIIVEGYMDLIALYKAGFQNVVATLGTALTKEHCHLIKRYTKNVFVLFDGDEAGIRASERSLPLLLEAGLYPKSVSLPEGQDPDDFLQNAGAKAFQEALDNAPDLFTTTLQRWIQSRSMKGPGDKIQLVEKLAPIFQVVQSSSLLHLYRETTVDLMAVTPKWLSMTLSEKAKNSRQKRDYSPPSAQPVKTPSAPAKKEEKPSDFNIINISSAPRAELFLLSAGLLSKNHISRIAESNVSQYLTHGGIKKLFERIIDVSRQTPEKFDNLLALLSSFVDKPSLLMIAAERGEIDHHTEEEKLVSDCMKRVKESYLKERAKTLSSSLKGQSNPEKLEQFMNVQKDRIALDKL